MLRIAYIDADGKGSRYADVGAAPRQSGASSSVGAFSSTHMPAPNLSPAIRASTVRASACRSRGPAGELLDCRDHQFGRDPVRLVAEVLDPDQFGARNVARQPDRMDLLIDDRIGVARNHHGRRF